MAVPPSARRFAITSPASIPTLASRMRAVWLDRFAIRYSVIGNVLGSTSQKPTAYEGCGIRAILPPRLSELRQLSDAALGRRLSRGRVPADVNVRNNVIRWGNYDYFTKTVRFEGVGDSLKRALGQPITSSPRLLCLLGQTRVVGRRRRLAAYWSGCDRRQWRHLRSCQQNSLRSFAGKKYNLKGGGAFNAATCYLPGLLTSVRKEAAATLVASFLSRVPARRKYASDQEIALSSRSWSAFRSHKSINLRGMRSKACTMA